MEMEMVTGNGIILTFDWFRAHAGCLFRTNA